MNRAERRYRAQRIAEKRWHQHMAPLTRRDLPLWIPPGPPPPPVGIYRKRGAWCCHHCTKHRAGSPHYGWGACYQGQGVRPTVAERRRDRKVIDEWLDEV